MILLPRSRVGSVGPVSDAHRIDRSSGTYVAHRICATPPLHMSHCRPRRGYAHPGTIGYEADASICTFEQWYYTVECRKKLRKDVLHCERRKRQPEVILDGGRQYNGCSAPPARKKNCTLYSDGRQDYTPCIRSMLGRQFLITPSKTLVAVIMSEKIPDKPL